MNFRDKYTDNPKDETKKLLSSEGYAIGELLEQIVRQISRSVK